MAIRLDHLIVPSHEPVGAAKLLAGLLDVPWEPSGEPFKAVYVNDTLTVDFARREQFEGHHYCFHVDDHDFDAIFGWIAARGMAYRSHPRGEIDMKINTRLGGRNLYWDDDDGHLWEILTISYARAGAASA